jgi:phage virion morphogenesis protein
MKTTITVKDKPVQALLRRVMAATSDASLAMREFGQWYERRVLENFEREQAPDGTPWARLSAATLMMGLGRKKGFGKGKGLTQRGRTYLQNKKILVASHRMKDRIHHQADATGMRIGVNGIPYGAIHQFGGMAGRGRKVKIPARPWLALNQGNDLVLAPRDRTMAIGLLTKHLTQAFRG